MRVIKIKNLIIVFSLILTTVAFVFCGYAVIKTSATSYTNNPVTIVLDAGHGGIDGGVTGKVSKVKESDLNLIYVKKLRQLLESANFKVVLTRQTEAGLYGITAQNKKKQDMLKRKEILLSANPTLVVSIHMNNFSSSLARGGQVFYNGENELSKVLAKNIQTSINNMEECKKQNNILAGDYYIVKCTEYPSVICECGFLSNPEEEKLLINESYQDKMCYAIFKGIVGYLAEESFIFTD